MISLLVVNYRSAALAADAVRSARAAVSESLQVVVVDNSCDGAEAGRLRPHADVTVVSPANIGYGAAINSGRRHCSGELIIACNPDVVFAPGSIDELKSVFADDRVAVAGPALFWDNAHRWLLPPADLRTAIDKLDEGLASRFSPWLRWRDRRRLRHRLRFWSLQTATVVEAISGAVMAIRARDFDAVGGFDERFPLYFEENDFLRRIARKGRAIVYVPSSRCRHLYNQSAGEARDFASAAYARSERLYLEKWYSKTLAAILKSWERPIAVKDVQRLDGPLELPDGDLVVEASPLPTFSTAAGHFPRSRTVDLPDEVWRSYQDEVVYLRIADRITARPLGIYARYRS